MNKQLIIIVIALFLQLNLSVCEVMERRLESRCLQMPGMRKY